MRSCKHVGKESVSQEPGCVPDVALAEPRQTQLSQQPPRGQLFLHVPRCLAIAAPTALAWIGTHHLAMMGPITLPCPATNACRTVDLEQLSATAASGQQCAGDPASKLAARHPCRQLTLPVDSTFAGFRAVDCPLRLRVSDAFSCYKEDDSDWMDIWRVQFSCPTSRYGAPVL